VQALREPLARHGISVIQSPEMLLEGERRVLRLVTRLSHSSGEFAEFSTAWPMPPSANIQQLAAAITYLRRYTLCSLFCVVGDPDDDAEIIVSPTREKGKQQHDPARSNPNR